MASIHNIRENSVHLNIHVGKREIIQLEIMQLKRTHLDKNKHVN